jgi:hypothetical protein
VIELSSQDIVLKRYFLKVPFAARLAGSKREASGFPVEAFVRVESSDQSHRFHARDRRLVIATTMIR